MKREKRTRGSVSHLKNKHDLACRKLRACSGADAMEPPSMILLYVNVITSATDNHLLERDKRLDSTLTCAHVRLWRHWHGCPVPSAENMHEKRLTKWKRTNEKRRNTQRSASRTTAHEKNHTSTPIFCQDMEKYSKLRQHVSDRDSEPWYFTGNFWNSFFLAKHGYVSLATTADRAFLKTLVEENICNVAQSARHNFESRKKSTLHEISTLWFPRNFNVLISRKSQTVRFVLEHSEFWKNNGSIHVISFSDRLSNNSWYGNHCESEKRWNLLKIKISWKSNFVDVKISFQNWRNSDYWTFDPVWQNRSATDDILLWSWMLGAPNKNRKMGKCLLGSIISRSPSLWDCVKRCRRSQPPHACITRTRPHRSAEWKREERRLLRPVRNTACCTQRAVLHPSGWVPELTWKKTFNQFSLPKRNAGRRAVGETCKHGYCSFTNCFARLGGRNDGQRVGDLQYLLYLFYLVEFGERLNKKEITVMLPSKKITE